MPHGAGRKLPTHGETTSAPTMPIATVAEVSGIGGRRRRLVHFQPIDSGSTIWWEMSGSGLRIVITKLTREPRVTARHGLQTIVLLLLSEAVHGDLVQRGCARPHAVGIPTTM